MKTMRCSRFAGSASAGTTTPFGTTAYSPGSQRCTETRACSDTAMRRSIRAARKPQANLPILIQVSSPLAWKVATIGPGQSARAATPIAGVMGSWTWITSKRSRSKIRLIRRGVVGLSTMFGSDPFAGTITERPTGSTYSGGSA